MKRGSRMDSTVVTRGRGGTQETRNGDVRTGEIKRGN